MRTGEGVRVYANDDVSHRNKRCCPSTVGVVGWCGCRLSVRLSPSDDLETSSFISRNGTSIRQRSHIMLLSSLLSAPLSPLISSSPVLFSHTVLPSHCLSSSGLSSFSNSLIASDDAVPYVKYMYSGGSRFLQQRHGEVQEFDREPIGCQLRRNGKCLA